MKNFRGIAEGDLNGFAQINLFVGENNSGKTTVLEALYLAATTDRLGSVTINPRLRDNAQHTIPEETPFREIYLSAEKDMLGLNPMSRIWQRHNIPPTWDNTSSVWVDNRQIGLAGLREPLDVLDSLSPSDRRGFSEGDEKRIALLRVDPELAETDEETDEEDEKFQIPTFAESYFGDKAIPLDNRSFLLIWHPFFTYNLNGVGGWFVESAGNLPPANNILLYDFHTTSDNLMFHMIGRGYSDTDSFLRRIAKDLQQVFSLPNEPYVSFDVIQDQERRRGSVEQNQRMLPVDLWGDGMRHAMKLIAPLLILHDDATEEKPGMVLWEDPELFMNPATLRPLIRYVAQMIQGKPIQLFITTHSIEVIACLTEMLRGKELPETSTKAFQLHRTEESLQVSWFDHDNLIIWLENGLDPRFWEQQEMPLVYHMGGTA